MVLFLSAVNKAECWLESKVLYIAEGCAHFILSTGLKCSLTVRKELPTDLLDEH